MKEYKSDNSEIPKFFFHCPGYGFQDFDLIVEKGCLFAVYVKKEIYSKNQCDAKKPNCYGLAKTHDGYNWSDIGTVLIPGPIGSWDESLWAGSVSKQDGRYVLYYSAVKILERQQSCKFGKAYSDDLVNWKKDPENPILSVDRVFAVRMRSAIFNISAGFYLLGDDIRQSSALSMVSR
jgi:hypothetical protein